MLKSFREENVISLDQFSKEVDRVVDNWVSDLLRAMVSSPMDPTAKRSLWDRFKGTLSNIWYGGKYNPQNPYYWKHRFGDELGSTVEPKKENFDPSVFSLQEYNQLKSTVDAFEQAINEQDLPAGADKLRLVQIIKSEAEKLKKNLKDIFAASQQVSPVPSTTDLPVASPEVPTAPSEKVSVTKIKRRVGRPRKAVSVKQDLPSPPEYMVGSEENYKNWLPKKENTGRSLDDLRKDKQYVDYILHPEYGVNNFYDADNDESVESAANHKIKILEKLKDDAIRHNENSEVINKILEAITKMKKFYEK